VKHTLILSTIFYLLIAGQHSSLRAQSSLRIGFVNSTKILLEYREAQEANKKLDQMATQWKSELEHMSDELKAKYEDYKKKESLMPDAQKRSTQEDLALLEQKGVQYRQQKFGNDGDLAMMTDSLLRPVKQKVLKVIEQVAKDERLQFIFDRNDQITVLLYGDEKFDYTNFIIDRLKRGAAKSKE
jgi:outer membrane protein